MPPEARLDLREDRAWLDAFRRGERDALRRIFDTYADYAVSVLVKTGARYGFIIGASERADLTQEVFVRALGADARTSYDGMRAYSTFLAGIAKNVLLEHFRKHKRTADHEIKSENAVDGAWSPTDPLPDEIALRAEEEALVLSFLASLSNAEKEFVAVRFENGKTQEETAAALSLSRQTVRTREKHLRERLDAHMKERGVEFVANHGDRQNQIKGPG